MRPNAELYINYYYIYMDMVPVAICPCDVGTNLNSPQIVQLTHISQQLMCSHVVISLIPGKFPIYSLTLYTLFPRDLKAKQREAIGEFVQGLTST